jgi:predicted RecA/RadA family phage recombinase
MTTKLTQDGQYMTYTTTAAVTVGDVKIIGSKMVGVALDAATGSGVSIQLGTQGVFNVLRTAAATLVTQGENVYFTSTGAAVATTTSNVYGGKLWEAVSPTGAVLCLVNINFGSESV